MALGHFLELAAMIEDDGQHLRPVTPSRSSAVKMLKIGVEARLGQPAPVLQEDRHLPCARHGRGAPVSGYHQGAAGVAELATTLQALAAQPAAEKAGHESITSAQDVEDLDRKAGNHNALRQIVGNRPIEHDAPLGATL